MNNYHDFEVKDWLEDRRFQNWVYRGESNYFWLNFLENTPNQAANIDQARSILLSLRGEAGAISTKAVKQRVAEILDGISDDDKEQTRQWWKGKWLLAASILLVIGVGVSNMYVKSLFRQPEPYYTMLDKHRKGDLIEVVNHSESIRLVNLPDGSSVILNKSARIAYPHQFDAAKREVFMLGEAFFEVYKNPEQPFYIYTGEMVTKVKGTSFSIKANEASDEVSLVVKSGIVEVSIPDEKGNIAKDEIQVLAPDQLVTLNRKSLKMSKKNVVNASLINVSAETQNFSFKRTRLRDVFGLLEKTYGLKIDFDRVITSGCSITAQLGDEPVFEKLEMICAVVNARFEAKGSNIKIISNGCDGK